MPRRTRKSETRRAPRRAVRVAPRDDPPVLGTLAGAADRTLHERERGARGSHGFDGPSRWRADRPANRSSEDGRSDERVREAVCARLAGLQGLEARGIDVSVEDGEVVLSGHVASAAAKKLASDACGDVPGVAEVVNRIRVLPAPTRGDDREILGSLG